MKPYSSISVVIAVYNDETVLQELHKRLQPVVTELTDDYEIIFIDDGSSDNSYKILLDLHEQDQNIKILKQARNFGQPNSIAAGLDYAIKDYVVLMDSDLQDRPEDIPKLLSALVESGSSMAIAKWIKRQDTSFKKAVSSLFFKVSKRITNLQHAPNLGVFRAVRREAIDKVKSIPETTGTLLSLMYWSGLSYEAVELHRDPRFAGISGYNLKKMLALTADRIFSYSLFPIKVATYFGVFMGLASIFLGVFFIIEKFALDSVVPGWTSLIVLLLFLFGMNFVFMGLIGEYLGRIYMESKGRPRYVTEIVVDTSVRSHNTNLENRIFISDSQ